MNEDYLNLTAEEFAALDDQQVQYALQLVAGRMSVEQARMRTYSEAYQAYLAAKEEHGRLRQLGSILQTTLRLAAK